MSSIYYNRISDDPLERLADTARFREIAARRPDLVRSERHAPCPDCGAEARLVRDPIAGREGAPDALYICPGCGGSFDPKEMR